MPLSAIFKETEELLEEVLRTIREEYESPYSVLCETERNQFVDEEEILRQQLKETVESESNRCQWRSLIGLSSPQAAKCLKDAEELRQRVKEGINEKLRTRLTGKSNPPPSASREQGSAFNLMGTRTPEADTGRPLADANPEPASTIITSPANMSCSSPENSEVILYPAAVQNDDDYTSDLNEAINSPLETSSDRSRDSSSSRRQRRPPPPPPALRRVPQSSNPHLLSETTSNPGSASPRRSPSVRRPAPPPPQSTRQSRTPGSPISGYFPPPSPLSPNSISEFTQQINNLVSSIVKDGASRQAQGRRGLKHSEDYVTKTNCVDITGSNVDGVTLNNGGYQNSGAVIHKTTLLPRPPQPVPRV